MTRPMSVWNPNNALIAMVTGLPAVTVRMRAKTTSTHEKMKQKKAVTPMPGAIAGTSSFTKKPGSEWPSRNADSSNSRGMAEMKLSRIQMEIGRLNRQWTSAIPTGEFTRLTWENRMKIGSESTTGGMTRKASITNSRCRSPMKR